MRRIVPLLLLFWGACGDDVPKAPPTVAPSGDLPFAFVDVASELGYTMRNRSGKKGSKEFILEAMPPGIAVADFNADGWMDLFCPNGNDIAMYDRRTRAVTLLPSDDAPRNELYLNEQGKRFRPVGKSAGVDDQLWSFGAIAGDVDNDGDPDLYVCNWGPNRLHLNDGTGSFQEKAKELGAAGDALGWSTGACFIDYDRDGDLDIYVAQYADMYVYFDDKNSTTIDDTGVHGRSCQWKKLDVYCGPFGLWPQNDFFLENQLMETGTLSFKDVSREVGILFELNERSNTDMSQGPFWSFVPVSWDMDGNGWPDIMVANDSVGNNCWMNEGGKKFVDRAAEMGLQLCQDDFKAQASMGIGIGDLNNDGLFDMIMSEFSHDQFNVLLAERLPSGKIVYEERASRIGVRDLTFSKLGWGANLFDADLDGDLDAFFACGHVYPEVDHAVFRSQNTPYRQTNLLLLNQDAKRVRLVDVSADAGPGLNIAKVSRASVAVDFDNDGDLDIATTELNDTPCLLRCDLDPKRAPHHWLMVRLIGRPKAGVPRDPTGSKIRVIAGELEIHRLFFIGSSFQSSEDPRVHFGLGTNAKADLVEVTWIDGTTTTVTDVSADQVIVIEYPDK